MLLLVGDKTDHNRSSLMFSRSASRSETHLWSDGESESLHVSVPDEVMFPKRQAGRNNYHMRQVFRT